MQTVKKDLSPTKVELNITADVDMLSSTKTHVLKELAKDVNLEGFRKGRAPLHLIEKSVDQTILQREFLNHAVNDLYVAAVEKDHLRPVSQPEVSVTKFVPFSTLEISVEVEAVGQISLPDYTKIRLAKTPVDITQTEIDAVLHDLQNREATRKEVKRVAKDGDEVTIDFSGVDSKTKLPVTGADGKDYKLILGSNVFIPGFEPQLVGLKIGDKKTFDITFPSDYNVAGLQNKKVTFDVEVKKVEELSLPRIDDKFAGKIGPFKTMGELNTDIRKQLTAEKTNQNDRSYENKLLDLVASKTKVAIPKALTDDEIDRMETEEKRNLVYRGQTWQEHLDQDGITEEQHHERQREVAENRVKAGLVLAEVAEKEKVVVTPEELEVRMQLIKGQYPDKQMQAELDKPESRREILNRLISEKTIASLTNYANK